MSPSEKPEGKEGQPGPASDEGEAQLSEEQLEHVAGGVMSGDEDDIDDLEIERVTRAPRP